MKFCFKFRFFAVFNKSVVCGTYLLGSVRALTVSNGLEFCRGVAQLLFFLFWMSSSPLKVSVFSVKYFVIRKAILARFE